MMKIKKPLTIVFALLILSNAYFFYAALQWRSAWLSQLLTTSDVEQVFKSSGADISKKSISSIITGSIDSKYEAVVFGGSNIPAHSTVDESALHFQDTYFLFRDDLYAGSKADLPQIVGPLGTEGIWLMEDF